MILINKNELLDHLKYMSKIRIDQLEGVIDRLPSMEIVRCKDCVYWKYRTNYKGDEWGACLFLEDVEHWTEDTAFCSCGERSEE